MICIILMLTYMLIQEIVHVIGCDRGKMSPKTLTLELRRPPEELLLAPEVAPAVELFPAYLIFVTGATGLPV